MGNILAIYVRLSEADGKEEVSNSIINQKKMIYDYLKKHSEFQNYTIREYIDDGVSGTKFEKRPALSKMVEDVESGKIKIIIVKDLSRLGRNYLDVGYYLDVLFPSKGIRFIAINDGYDGVKGASSDIQIPIAFKNLINEMYSMDLGKKVKSSIRARNEKGEYTAAYPGYGYKKDPKDCHKLQIDEEAAEVIKKIFTLAAQGEKLNQIAKILNEEKIPTRATHQRSNGVNLPKYEKGGGAIWTPGMVIDIIKNEKYTGKMIQNKYRSVGLGDRRKIVMEQKEKWVVINGGIPAIVSQDLFDRANALHRAGKKKQKTGEINLFYCPYCGRKLHINYGYYGTAYCVMKNSIENVKCKDVVISQQKLQEYVTMAVNQMAKLIMEKKDFPSEKDDGKMISEKKRELEILEKSIVSEYNNYKSGMITKEQFIHNRIAIKKNLAVLEQEIDKLLQRLKKKEGEEKNIIKEKAEKLRLVKGFDSQMFAFFIDKVFVYANDQIEIIWK